MPELLKNEEKSIRSYILNDVLEKVPIDKSYENLCKVIGKDAIAFYDFQYWYYRFLSGNQDLEFDRSSEPEPLQFSNLPIDAVGLIVDNLGFMEKLMLRRVSKPLREFIEKQRIDCTYIAISCGNDFIRVKYGSEEILYAKNEEAVKRYERVYGVGRSLNIINGNESVACDDLASVLKIPKLQLAHLYLSTIWCVKDRLLSKFLNKLEFELKSLKHQIAVREIHFQPELPNDILAILPYLKPGYLETIQITQGNRTLVWKSDENSRKLEKIMQLEQWKKANELILFEALHLFPDEVFLQFKKYTIVTRMLNQSQLFRIGMKFAVSPVFEYCRFYIFRRSEEEDFLDFIGVPGPLTESYRSVRHYMIPNTDKLLVFKQCNSSEIVAIEKKTREVQ